MLKHWSKSFYVILQSCFIITGLLYSPLSAEVVSCKDKTGKIVNVQVPVKRAVLLTTYELIPALGIWDQIAASGKWTNSNDLIRASGRNLSSLPSVGSGIDINMESMMKIRPDLVVSWTFRQEQVNFMEDKGLTVISIYPDSMAELYEVLKLHGRLFGKEKRMDYCLSRMDEIFSLIKKRSCKIKNSEKQKVLWLGGRPTGVSGAAGLTNDIIKLIGAVNSASEIGGRNSDVSVEKIIRWNPDVIFIWGNATYGASDILNNPQWKHIKAVKDGRVYKAPEWSTWSPRVAPVALWMAIRTYPSFYKDINFEEVTDNFYRKVFNIPYSMVKKIEN